MWTNRVASDLDERHGIHVNVEPDTAELLSLMVRFGQRRMQPMVQKTTRRAFE